MIEVFMPKAGMDMREGRVIRWLKEVGDPVELNEPIVEIETDKITMEAESPGTGFLLAKLAGDDTVVPVLQTIGYIGEKNEKVPEQAAPAAPAQAEAAEQPAAPATEQARPAARQLSATGGAVPATPYAKALAREKGIDLSSVPPTGKHGEVLGADVLGAQVSASSLASRMARGMDASLQSIAGSGHGGKMMKADVPASRSTPRGEVRKPVTGARKVIAERMLKSHTEIPPVTQHMKVNVGKLLELREKLNRGREQKISVNDLMIKIVARAVAEHPLARTVLQGNEYVTKPDANIGFAVGMDEGLLVPVVKNADLLPLSEISAQAKDLAARARGGKIRPDELSGGTFTISNMGMFDIFAFTPIINQPEAGILGICAAQDELALKDGNVVVAKVMIISLTFDHRIMDGAGAAAFQRRIKELMEHPQEALDLHI